MAFCRSKLLSKTLTIRLKPPGTAAPMSTLMGPPALQSFVKQLKMEASGDAAAAFRDPFVDWTESTRYVYSMEFHIPTYLPSGDPCLDFYFHVIPDTPPEYARYRLQEAWNHHPLTALKLICHQRSVSGTGKSDKEGFYTSAIWLHHFHPKTLAANVASVAKFGCIKDLPEILYRLLEGSDVRKAQKAERWKIKGRRLFKYHKYHHRKTGSKTEEHIPQLEINREMRILNELKRGKLLKERAAMLREEKRVTMAKKALERYYKDSAFRFLYDRVSDFFAESLKADMEYLNSNQTSKVSLAAKWCPSLDSSFDKLMLLCESIARKIFPRELYPEYEGLEEAYYVYRIRDRLRKEVLVPLRKVLELPEVYMSFNKWGEIQYNQVAWVAMKLYKDKFLKHDQERFNKYMEEVESEKSKIAERALLPHEIIKSLKEEDSGQMAELQWKRMVDDLRKQGKFKNCMAICDEINLGVLRPLGLLVSELSEEPWKGKLITFSENPALQMVEGDTLSQKITFMEKLEGGCAVDFQKVFDLILQVAVDGQLKEEDMIKKLFVFSLSEFDQASASNWQYGIRSRSFMPREAESIWETEYEAIVMKFREQGYGNVVPEIVFWNLKASKSTPVVARKKGVVLVSGFSKNFLKLFLNGDDYTDPVFVMQDDISMEEYLNLSVID